MYHVLAAHIYGFGLITCITRHTSTLITVDADASRCRCNHFHGAQPFSVHPSFLHPTPSTIPPLELIQVSTSSLLEDILTGRKPMLHSTDTFLLRRQVYHIVSITMVHLNTKLAFDIDEKRAT
jgi:hypothetical protein